MYAQKCDIGDRLDMQICIKRYRRKQRKISAEKIFKKFFCQTPFGKILPGFSLDSEYDGYVFVSSAKFR